MTLDEYVAAVIEDPEVHDGGWYPTGWTVEKRGPLHVEDHQNEGVSLCGMERPEQPYMLGPARVMLRRMNGCKNCEKAVKHEPEN